MINFRYHVISLIAVFLALAIGVIMGSAVIDRAIVDRLENQQEGLREDIREVQETNDALRAENRDLRETAEQLTEEGSQRLLTGTLGDVPVLVVATRGVDDDGFDALLSLLATSGADRRGTLCSPTASPSTTRTRCATSRLRSTRPRGWRPTPCANGR